jgi:hypothetical protein
MFAISVAFPLLFSTLVYVNANMVLGLFYDALPTAVFMWHH